MSGPQSEQTTPRGRREDTAMVIQTSTGGCIVTAIAQVYADGSVQTCDDFFPSIEAWLDSLTPEDVGTFDYITFEGPDLEPYEWVIERITQLRRQWNGNHFPGPSIEPPGHQSSAGIPVSHGQPGDPPQKHCRPASSAGRHLSARWC